MSILCEKRYERENQIQLEGNALYISKISLWKKGWKVYDMETQEIFVSRDVKFVENDFPFQMTKTNGSNDLA